MNTKQPTVAEIGLFEKLLLRAYEILKIKRSID